MSPAATSDADPYVDPVTGIFHNLLGITELPALEQLEADLSFASLIALADRPLPGVYDLAHLQDFHRAIFGDIAASLPRSECACTTCILQAVGKSSELEDQVGSA